ncbi:MAG: PhzF family phenazine biosynthesis protein, partial [Bacteroidia bacterium]|nr:PhzF family phenazine biosynthesis protein [Bacteroidia bacterium]
PLYGIEEEAATGMAAGPLACLLYRESRQKEIFYFIEQGKFMNPPSPSAIEIILDIKNKEISRLYVGGSAYKSEVLEIQID